MKVCRLCGRRKPAEQFLAGKARKPSSSCAGCRRNRQRSHIKGYYARMSPDDRHTATHKARAERYGVEHAPYSRTEILRRWGHRCIYCGNLATHIDHIYPLSKGGADIESNVAPACAGCNLSKGSKTLAEWADVPLTPPPF